MADDEQIMKGNVELGDGHETNAATISALQAEVDALQTEVDSLTSTIADHDARILALENV